MKGKMEGQLRNIGRLCCFMIGLLRGFELQVIHVTTTSTDYSIFVCHASSVTNYGVSQVVGVNTRTTNKPLATQHTRVYGMRSTLKL